MKIQNSTQISKEVKDFFLTTPITECSSARVAYVLYAVISGGIGRPVVYSGNGKWRHTNNCSNEVIKILLEYGYKYEYGNDAPRGGQAGDFIRTISKIIPFLILVFAFASCAGIYSATENNITRNGTKTFNHHVEIISVQRVKTDSARNLVYQNNVQDR